MEIRNEMSKSSKQAAARLPTGQIVDQLVAAAMQLLAEKGPSEIKARSVAETAQVSTIALYYHLGGMPELFQAVVDKGFRDLTHAFSTVASSTDPVTDLFSMALTSRKIAQSNPHLYDLMFGLSTRGSYRPLQRSSAPSGARSGAFPAAYSHLVEACGRLRSSGRIRGDEDPEIVASQLWSCVHGFVTLELADHFVQFADPVRQVLLPATVNLLVGLGDNAGLCRASHTAAFARVSAAKSNALDPKPLARKTAAPRRKARISR